MPYYDPQLSYEDIVDRLKRLDEEAYVFAKVNNIPLNNKIIMHIAGSTCLTLRNLSTTKTDDIDVYYVSNFVSGIAIDKYDMNTRVSTYNLTYNYEDRLEKVDINTKVIDYYILSLEDTVVLKLAANRQKDMDNLDTEIVVTHIEWDKLRDIAEEMRYSVLNERLWREFAHTYNDYCRRWKHEECIITNI